MIIWWLEQRLNSNNDTIVVDALRSLGARPSAKTIAVLCDCWTTLSGRGTRVGAAREAAIVAIASADPRMVITALRNSAQSVDTTFLAQNLAKAAVPIDVLNAAVFDAGIPSTNRVALATALAERSAENPGSARIFRQLLDEKDPALREAAVDGLAGLRDPTDTATLIERMRADPASSIRRRAANAIRDRGCADEMKLECAVVTGDAAKIIAGGAAALPFLLRDLALRSEDDVPAALDQSAALLRTHARDTLTPTLETLASRHDPAYSSDQLGSGHIHVGFGHADASVVRELARAELARR